MAVAALALAVAGTFSQPTNAQTAAVSSGNCFYWIDAKTGDRVRTVPIGIYPEQLTSLQVGGIPNSISGAGGHSYVKQPDGSWIDAATAAQVRTVPIGIYPEQLTSLQVGGIPNSISGAGGHSYVLIPCPPPQTAASSGVYIGGELVKNWGRVRSTETRDATGVLTNQFIDSGDPLGVGIVGGYNFKPWNNNIVIGPFASFDYLNQTINHNFAGGQFLGTTTHWFINAGVKAGVVTGPGFYLYGLAAAAWLNHDLNVNFATAAQRNVNTPGFTLGLGGEYAPSSWQLLGHPVSLFAQYQHTWWDNANFNTPTSSPAFNYAFRREDDTIKLGVNFYFGSGPTPAAAPSYPVKAPMLK